MLVSQASKFQKGSANQRAKHLLGNGLLTADGALHAGRRRLIQPAFARQRLEDCGPAIVARARAMCERWSQDQVVDVMRSMGALTFGIVGETVIGAAVEPLFEGVRQAVSEATHRDERYFDRPTVFDPDRWVHGRQDDRPRLAYLPFGAGPRSCIGESFGLMEGVLLLATIAKRWRLRPVDAAFPEIEPRITLRPRQPVRLRVSAI